MLCRSRATSGCARPRSARSIGERGAVAALGLVEIAGGARDRAERRVDGRDVERVLARERDEPRARARSSSVASLVEVAAVVRDEAAHARAASATRCGGAPARSTAACGDRAEVVGGCRDRGARRRPRRARSTRARRHRRRDRARRRRPRRGRRSAASASGRRARSASACDEQRLGERRLRDRSRARVVDERGRVGRRRGARVAERDRRAQRGERGLRPRARKAARARDRAAADPGVRRSRHSDGRRQGRERVEHAVGEPGRREPDERGELGAALIEAAPRTAVPPAARSRAAARRVALARPAARPRVERRRRWPRPASSPASRASGAFQIAASSRAPTAQLGRQRARASRARSRRSRARRRLLPRRDPRVGRRRAALRLERVGDRGHRRETPAGSTARQRRIACIEPARHAARARGHCPPRSRAAARPSVAPANGRAPASTSYGATPKLN